MKKLLAISTLTLGTLALTAGSASAAVIIDSFDNGLTDQRLSGPAPQTFTDSVSAAGILGGTRDIEFNLIEGANASRRADLFINDQNDTLSLSNGNAVNSNVTLSYGPGLNQPIGTGAFSFEVIAYDAPQNNPATITLTVNGVSETLPILSTGLLSFPTSSFGDPSTLNSISFTIAGPTSFDVEIDKFTFDGEINPVPEPMTIIGSGFVLAALPGLKKAHKNKKPQ